MSSDSACFGLTRCFTGAMAVEQKLVPKEYERLSDAPLTRPRRGLHVLSATSRPAIKHRAYTTKAKAGWGDDEVLDGFAAGCKGCSIFHHLDTGSGGSSKAKAAVASYSCT